MLGIALVFQKSENIFCRKSLTVGTSCQQCLDIGISGVAGFFL